eukprot:5180574-Pyramimonas_sp.AAC.1
MSLMIQVVRGSKSISVSMAPHGAKRPVSFFSIDLRCKIRSSAAFVRMVGVALQERGALFCGVRIPTEFSGPREHARIQLMHVSRWRVSLWPRPRHSLSVGRGFEL